MTTIGVVLSGCGVFDGAEIHESVITLLALDRLGVKTLCMAPDESFAVIDHRTQKPTGERRNVLDESARIARGQIRDLAGVQASELDALVFPGGFGAAKNLSTFAVDGPNCTVNKDVQRLVLDMHAAKKPIGALCIAPATIAKILGKEVTVTIGDDPGTAGAIEKTGAHHKTCLVSEFFVDEKARVVSTPAYMKAGNIREAAEGIEKLCRKVVEMAR